MSIVRIGTTQKYAEGWDRIFGRGKKGPSQQASTSSAKMKKKKSPKGKKKKRR